MATELISSEIMQIYLKNGNGRQRINLLCKRLEVDLSTIFRVTKFPVTKKKKESNVKMMSSGRFKYCRVMLTVTATWESFDLTWRTSCISNVELWHFRISLAAPSSWMLAPGFTFKKSSQHLSIHSTVASSLEKQLFTGRIGFCSLIN